MPSTTATENKAPFAFRTADAGRLIVTSPTPLIVLTLSSQGVAPRARSAPVAPMEMAKTIEKTVSMGINGRAVAQAFGNTTGPTSGRHT